MLVPQEVQRSKSTLVLGEPWWSAVVKVWCEMQGVKSEATASQGGEEFTESTPPQKLNT